ncbi:MAG TPA: F0F1 ATP synthase subunit A [Lentimicrobium sp.]|nr:F0F1 ATP synthase subunit A [Lentimicrobium sp.]
MRKYLLSIGLILSVLIGWSSPQENQGHKDTTDDHEMHQKEEFNAGHLIIDHIVDSHDWHIATVGEREISIPLPVILIDNGQLVVFSSKRFEHGHASYKGYKLETERNVNKGKIVKVKPGTMETDTTAGKPVDLSVTKTVVGIFVSVILMIVIFFSVARSYTRNAGHAPKGLQSWLEPLILFIRDDVAAPSIGKHYERYMPFLLTTFFFIFFSNLIGLVPFFPGGANVTGNIAVTLVLAAFTFVIILIKANKDYWIHIFNPPGIPWWLKFPLPLIPIIELAGVFIKPFVLMVRLFANIAAGHIIVLGFIALIFIFGQMSHALAYGVSLISVPFSIFISLLELLVAFIQAYVFTMLSALYIGMATEEHAHTDVLP